MVYNELLSRGRNINVKTLEMDGSASLSASLESTVSDNQGVTLQPPRPAMIKSLPSTSGTDQWRVFGRNTAVSKIIFLSQIIAIYTVIFTSLLNLSLISAGVLPNSSMLNLWSTLLASSIGYILPSPKMKTKQVDK